MDLSQWQLAVIVPQLAFKTPYCQTAYPCLPLPCQFDHAVHPFFGYPRTTARSTTSSSSLRIQQNQVSDSVNRITAQEQTSFASHSSQLVCCSRCVSSMESSTSCSWLSLSGCSGMSLSQMTATTKLTYLNGKGEIQKW